VESVKIKKNAKNTNI